MSFKFLFGRAVNAHLSSLQRLVPESFRNVCSQQASLVGVRSKLRHTPFLFINTGFHHQAHSSCARTLFCEKANLSNWILKPKFSVFQVRHFGRQKRNFFTRDKEAKSVVIYICAAGIFMLGMSYAGVPLYRIFCRATGLGGQATQGHDASKVESMAPVKNRVIRVRFNADVASSMRWNFKPQQTEVKVAPGETALAFYTARNPTEKPIIGISTYNVVPFEAGQYFNKIQCFCFEEQRLNPHEQVDMPVFFFIDPEYADDPKLEGVEVITLSYTFFEAKEGLQLPLPGYMAS